MKVLFWSPVPYARHAVLDALAEVDGVTTTLVSSLDECVAGVGDADLLVCGDAPEPDARAVLDAVASPASRVRSLHFVSAGRDGFERAGIPEWLAVSGPEGASAPTVAEHALALVLALERQLGHAVTATTAGEWDRSRAREARSLEGQTVLVVGLGHVGGEVAARLRPFGATVIGLRRTARPDPRADVVDEMSNLEAYLPEADVIVLAAALAPETERLMDRERLAACKHGVIVVNVGRGGLVDSEALAEALHSGQVRGAGLDVTDPEPLPPGHRLWSAPNTIITAHYAGGGSPATLRRVGRSVADRVRGLVAVGAEQVEASR